MKKLLVLAVLLAFAGKTLADVNMFIAKEQARRASGQAAAGGQPQAPSSSAPSATPVDPALAATLQNVGDLKADLDALVKASDAEAGGEQRIPLLNHLSSAAAPGKKATTASVKKIAGQLVTAISGKKNLSAQTTKLAQSLHALFNGAHLSAAQQETVLNGFKKILTDGGVAADDADKLVADLKQVAAETQ
jgi:hypothetical protein